MKGIAAQVKNDVSFKADHPAGKIRDESGE
jgi:hypothetical protein